MDDINAQVKRLDHLGIVAGVYKDLSIGSMIDERLGVKKQECISSGEATLGMVLNGLGFTGEALYLSPHFFTNKALEKLFGRDDITATNFNADKLGATLDKLYDYGLEKIFFEIALHAARKENVDMKFQSLDTTSISLQGEYDNELDEQSIKVVRGFSKDKRPDLKQVVHELMVSQDGGIPLICKSWSGNANDSIIFKDRAKKLMDNFESASFDNTLIADSKLYTLPNADNLKNLSFITRIPNSIKKVITTIDSSISENNWVDIDNNNKYISHTVNHYGIKQRWIVVYSKAANSRAQKSVEKKIVNESSKLKSEINNINKAKITSKKDMDKLVKAAIKKLKLNDASYLITEKNIKNKGNYYQVDIEISVNKVKQEQFIERDSCYVIGTNEPKESLDELTVIQKYKSQNKSIENMGFRFMKDKDMFTSSIFVKTEQRIESMLFIMTVSLLVYSIAQRRLRKILESKSETLPDQLSQPTKTPTLKWIFKLLDGINVLKITINGVTKEIYEGIDNLKTRIIKYFGNSVRKIYGFQT